MDQVDLSEDWFSRLIWTNIQWLPNLVQRAANLNPIACFLRKSR
jgi:hypothetical protein